MKHVVNNGAESNSLGSSSKMTALLTALMLLSNLGVEAQNNTKNKTDIGNFYTNPTMVDADIFPKINMLTGLQPDDIKSLKAFRDTLNNETFVKDLKRKLTRRGQGDQHTALRQMIEGAIGEYLYVHSSSVVKDDNAAIDVYTDLYVPIITILYGKAHVLSERALINTYDSEVIHYDFSSADKQQKFTKESTRLGVRLEDFIDKVTSKKDVTYYSKNLMDLLVMYYQHRKYIWKNAAIEDEAKVVENIDPLALLRKGKTNNQVQSNTKSTNVDYDNEIKFFRVYLSQKDDTKLHEFWTTKFLTRDTQTQETFLLKYYVYQSFREAYDVMDKEAKTMGDLVAKHKIEAEKLRKSGATGTKQDSLWMDKYNLSMHFWMNALLNFTSKLEYAKDMQGLTLTYVVDNKKVSKPIKDMIKGLVQNKYEDTYAEQFYPTLKAVIGHLDNPTEPINIQYAELALEDGINDAGIKHVFEEFLSTVPLDWTQKNELKDIPLGSAVQDGFILLYPQNIQVLGTKDANNKATNNRDKMLAEWLMKQTTQKDVKFDQLSYITPAILTNLITAANANPHIESLEFNADLLRPNYNDSEREKAASSFAQLKEGKKLILRTSGEKGSVVKKLAATKADLVYLTYRLSEDEAKSLFENRVGSLLLPITENVTKGSLFTEQFKKFMENNKKKAITIEIGDYGIDEGALKVLVATSRGATQTHSYVFTNLQIGNKDGLENLQRIDGNVVLVTYPDDVPEATETILKYGTEYKGRNGNFNDLFLGADRPLTPKEQGLVQTNYKGESWGTNQNEITSSDLGTVLTIGHKNNKKNHNAHLKELNLPELNKLPSKKYLKKIKKAGVENVHFGQITDLTIKPLAKTLGKFDHVDLPLLEKISEEVAIQWLKKTDHGFALTASTLHESFFKTLTKARGNDTVDVRNMTTLYFSDGTSLDFHGLIPDIRDKNLQRVMYYLMQFENKGGVVILNPYFDLVYQQHKKELGVGGKEDTKGKNTKKK